MNRRLFLSTLSGGLLAAPLAAEAQQVGIRHRIGYVSLDPAPSNDAPALGIEALRWLARGVNIPEMFRRSGPV